MRYDDYLKSLTLLQEAMVPIKAIAGLGLAAKIDATWFPITKITPAEAEELLHWVSLPIDGPYS